MLRHLARRRSRGLISRLSPLGPEHLQRLPLFAGPGIMVSRSIRCASSSVSPMTRGACPSSDGRAEMVELKALGDELDRLIGQCGHGSIADCRIIEALAEIK